MEAECTWAPVKEEKVVIPLVPPGFASLTSFTLKKVHEGVTMSCMESSCALDLQMTSEECHNISDDGKLTRTRRRKPWVNYSRFDNSSEEESDSELIDQDSPPLCRLPKGVIRGCPECLNCQKVTAKWHPEDAQRPLLDDTPVFYPSEEEFNDTLKYIASIRSRAEPYGICRIVPPPSWNPPCPLREELMWEKASFATRIQQIDKLQNRISRKRLSGYHKHIMRRRRKRLRMQVEGRTNNGDVVDANEPGCFSQAESFGFEPGSQFTLEAFQKYADDFKGQYFRLEDPHTNPLFDQVEPKKQWEPSVENVEGEYWRIVGKPTEEIDVLYGADIETGVFGSGFPKSSSTPMDAPYAKSGWNLNNVSKLPSSLLCFESGDISGVQVPWLYVGMCFSSFCWHVEDHHLYSLNYLHWGAPKMWYGVPGNDALKLEAAMRKHLPDLFEEQHDLLNKLVTQLSPSILKSEGVPVYRCVQNPGEFVLTFPRAYHSGFNCGFNCAEAVNVAPVDWLPHGQGAVELYREQVRKTSVSHDKLLLGAAREAVRAHWELFLLRKNTLDNLRWKNVCGKDGVLLQALQTRVEMERLSRELLCSPSQSRKMDKEFDAINERECTICFYDLHLSAAGCNCSPERFACLNHAKQLCKCAWSMRFFLFRYELSELNILVEALGGKLSAIHRWAYLDLGLTVSSVITKDKSHESSPSTEGSEQKGQGTVNAVCSIESERRIPARINLTSNRADSPLYQEKNVAPLVLASKEGTFTHTMNIKEVACSNDTPVPVGHLPKIKREEHKPQFVDVGSVSNPNFLTYSACRPSKEDSSYVEPSESTASEKKTLEFSSLVRGIQPLRNKGETNSKTVRYQLAVDSNVILLSDDESEKSSPKSPEELSMRLTNMDDKVTMCNYQKDESLNMPKSNGTVMSEREARLLPVLEKGKPFSNVFVKLDDHGKDETGLESKVMMPNVSSTRSHSQNLSQNVHAAALTSVYLKESMSNHATNAESQVQHPLPCYTGKPKDEGKEEKSELDSSKIKDRAGSVTESLSGPTNNLDRYYRQKGPRMAKVVRRVNCVVELLELGVVLSGKLWSNCRTIYPKGFRSRVRYLSVMDPTKMCYYVSEILDAGLIGPLFMITVEQCPSEVFIQVSVTKCWDLVRERINIEIRKQHNLGRIGLPPLQPPIDGFEMFGFSSPTIIQAIEAIDRGHVCIDYWQSRTEATSCYSGSLAGDHKDTVDKPNNDQDAASDGDKKTSVGVEIVLRGLFKKANMVELHALHSMLSDNNTTSNQELLSQILVQEFQDRSKLNSSSNFT